MKNSNSSPLNSTDTNFNMFMISSSDLPDNEIETSLYKKLIAEIHKDRKSIQTHVALRHLLTFIYRKRGLYQFYAMIETLRRKHIYIDAYTVTYILNNTNVEYERMDIDSQETLREYYRKSILKF